MDDRVSGAGPGKARFGRPVMAMLGATSLAHLLNDLQQSLIPAVYPVLKSEFALDFGQIGLITLTFQLTASLLQPVVGAYTDRRPMPYSLPLGMVATLAGLLLLSVAPNFGTILVAAALVGLGSSVFHPEASRVARLASGGRYGFAQSLFQVGGNAGTALGPLLAAFVVVRDGQRSIAWFALAAVAAILILWRISRWYAAHLVAQRRTPAVPVAALPRRVVARGIGVLLVLIFSKYIYLSSITSYYQFYLISKFGIGKEAAPLYLFVFLGAVALGTILGGPIGDRFGRKPVIWGSILGVLPFTLALPHANLFWTAALSAVIGVILASAFSAIVVFAQDLVPGKVGMVSGLFFGFAFGMAGVGAAVLGVVADHHEHRIRLRRLRLHAGAGPADLVPAGRDAAAPADPPRRSVAGGRRRGLAPQRRRGCAPQCRRGCAPQCRRGSAPQCRRGSAPQRRQHGVEEAGGAESEGRRRRPARAQGGVGEGEVATCGLDGADAPRRLEADRPSAPADRLQHHPRGLGRRIDGDLAGRGLEEVRPCRDREVGGAGDRPGVAQLAGLQDGLQGRAGAGGPHGRDCLRDRRLVAGAQAAVGDHEVDLVGAVREGGQCLRGRGFG